MTKLVYFADSCVEMSSEALEALKSTFRYVVAAGGVVYSPAGEILMIHRNGRWDLPKGHMESGESTAQCALREVEEECGVG